MKIIIIFSLLMVSCNMLNNSTDVKEEDAIKIAEGVWKERYGNDIEYYKPYTAKLIDEKWIVSGTLKDGARGGVPYIEIEKNTGQILKVGHSK